MALKKNPFVDGFPGITNGGCFLVGKCNGVDRIGVLVVEDEDVLVSATGGDGKVSSLIRIGLKDILVGEKHAAKVMMFGGGETGGVFAVGTRSNVLVVLIGMGRGAFGRA